MNFEDACKSNDKTQRELHRQRDAVSFYVQQRARKLNIAEQLRRALGLKVHRVERQAKFPNVAGRPGTIRLFQHSHFNIPEACGCGCRAQVCLRIHRTMTNCTTVPQCSKQRASSEPLSSKEGGGGGGGIKKEKNLWHEAHLSGFYDFPDKKKADTI